MGGRGSVGTQLADAVPAALNPIERYSSGSNVEADAGHKPNVVPAPIEFASGNTHNASFARQRLPKITCGLP